MPQIVFVAVCCLLLLLAAERFIISRARKKISLLIHVNGARGKSTVTRMIHALLRAEGYVAFGKTSGSRAMLLLPDGGERPIRRLGPANVREQRTMLLHCAFSGRANALVFECNAVKPDLQIISARYLSPDITVITNVREDHVREWGSPDEAAGAFAEAIPPGSALVTAEERFQEHWQKAAKRKNLQYRLVKIDEAVAGNEIPENIACALGVADCLSIDRAKALREILSYKADPGALAVFSWERDGYPAALIDARAANDTESTDTILKKSLAALEKEYADKTPYRILLVVNREDRPDRTRLFLRYALSQDCALFDTFLFAGHAPYYLRWVMKASGKRWRIVYRTADIETALPPTQFVVIAAVGNYCGKSPLVHEWIEAQKATGGGTP
jgi:poly-gamma-glutamate synthase PgsB/CapB